MHVDWSELTWAFKNSILQSVISSIVAVLVGLICSFGLLTYSEYSKKHWRTILEMMCLLPNFVPSIFILLAALNFFDPFPIGLSGVVIIHVLINYGLVAVVLAGLIESKLGGILELCYVEGVSRWKFLRKVFFPLMWKDLSYLGLFVFTICFSSFSIPLMVGGSQGTTLEVLIFEKIRMNADWSQAIFVAFIQSAFLFTVSFFALRDQASIGQNQTRHHLVHLPLGAFIIVLIFAAIVFGYAQGVYDGLRQLSRFYELQSAIISGVIGSLFLGIVAGLITMSLLLLIAFIWPLKWFEKFLSSYMTPSTTLTCFALLVFLPNENFWSYIKIPFAMVLISLTSLYRMGWGSELEKLKRQIEVSTCLGASHLKVWREIIIPQVLKRAGFFAGLISMWMCGDFAVSRILAHQDLSIAMMTQSLMTNYRLGMATVMSILIFFLSLVCFFILNGVSYVFSRKIKS